MKIDLQKILLDKYHTDKLASFYIVNYNSERTDPKQWVSTFSTSLTKVDDHPDILKINKLDSENEYKVDSESIKNFLKFINFRPIQLKRKFIFFFDAQDISVILSNKLLKVFEEMEANTTLFLMVPDNSFMLPTVLSRAVKLQIEENSNLIEKDIPPFDTYTTPQELLAYLKQNNGTQDEKRFIEHVINKSLAQGNYKDLDELLKVLSQHETFSNFNNSKLSRFGRFFS